MPRPANCTDEMIEFLEELRDGGTINMMGCAPHLQQEFGLGRHESQDCAKYWMFEHKPEEASSAE